MTELTADLGSLDLMPLLDRRDAPIIDTEAVAAALQFDIEPIFGTVALAPVLTPSKRLSRVVARFNPQFVVCRRNVRQFLPASCRPTPSPGRVTAAV